MKSHSFVTDFCELVMPFSESSCAVMVAAYAVSLGRSDTSSVCPGHVPAQNADAGLCHYSSPVSVRVLPGPLPAITGGGRARFISAALSYRRRSVRPSAPPDRPGLPSRRSHVIFHRPDGDLGSSVTW